MGFGSNKQLDVDRLKADLSAAGVELLSAHCATDRVRLRYSPQDIVTFGERQALQRSIASAEALHRFFANIESHLVHQDDQNR
jgi:hypothetical protein